MQRGEVWWVDFEPALGSEVKKNRPAVIISNDPGFFDCEKPEGGMWHIGAGPNSQSVMHTSGEITYWFACKYGETLAKPDGGSVVDVEFQPGCGLVVGRYT